MTKEIDAVSILEECVVINKQRGQTYNGTSTTPERSFKAIADIVNLKAGLSLKPSDVALILAELKYVRFKSAQQHGTVHKDSLVDSVNYQALWAELVAEETSNQQEVPEYKSAEDEYLLRAAAAMQFLSASREEIAESVPKGSTEALTAYSRAVKELNEISKPKQEALFGSSITDLITGDLDDPINSIATDSN